MILLTAAHPVPFNTAFYATIATVIPVLFLAIAVQGRLYEDLIKAAIRARDWPKSAKHFQQLIGRFFGSWIANVVLYALLAGILVSGVGGEIQALLALDWSRPVGDPAAAAQGVILLTVVAGIGPVLLIEKHFRPLVRDDWNRLRRIRSRAASDNMAQVNGCTATDQDASIPEKSADSAAADPEVT